MPVADSFWIIVETPTDKPKYTWVISSSRAVLHSKLAEEDEPFLREYGGHPIVKEALNRTEFRWVKLILRRGNIEADQRFYAPS